MELENGFEYKTLNDLNEYFKKTNSNLFFDVLECSEKIKLTDIEKCIENSLKNESLIFDAKYVFYTPNNEKIKINFSDKTNKNYCYTIETIDEFNRKITIYKEFENFKLMHECHRCNGKLYNLNLPAIIDYKDGKVICEIFYAYDKKCKKNYFDKLINIINNINEQTNFNAYTTKYLIMLNMIAMDLNNFKAINILSNQINIRKVMEKLEGKNETY